MSVIQLDSVEAPAVLDKKLDKIKRRLLVYVSGKYGDADTWGCDCNINCARKVAVELWKMGYAVICPHSNTAHMDYLDSRQVFLEGDMVMVERSDLLVMLPNWETSEGAQLERRLAMKLGIPVYYWDNHQIALQRIAQNDHRNRDARFMLFNRANRIANVTGYHPDFYASPSTGEVCSECGVDRQTRTTPVEIESLANRLRRDLAKERHAKELADLAKIKAANEHAEDKLLGGL